MLAKLHINIILFLIRTPWVFIHYLRIHQRIFATSYSFADFSDDKMLIYQYHNYSTRSIDWLAVGFESNASFNALSSASHDLSVFIEINVFG